ncbi:MAG: cupin domain-containing protein [Bacteroidales bacterium]|nr:cupin domain-containing protein [Bacteroidales bacterium]MBN2820801.1 cupin domain-containing protein [Bacteroidales bacterium]
MVNAEYWISHLGLKPHPEGGFYNEIFRSSVKIPKEELPIGYKSSRRVATSIYFLLRSGDISRLHRLRSDEIWYYHTGGPVKIVYIDKEGHKHKKFLGCNIEKAEEPCILISAGNIFAAEPVEQDSYCLMSCVVAPGFEFEDFEMFPKDELMQSYPKLSDIIEKYG